jgi:SPP1 gp7 family putative phage head morphogenesis protein
MTSSSKTIRIRRDPARAKPIISEYERRLSQLFKDYRARANNILKQADMMNLSHDALTNDLRTAATQILTPGNRIVSDMTLKSYRHGQAYADLQLKRAGIDPNRKLSARQRPKKLAIGISFEMRPDQAIFDILLKKSLSNLKGITDDMSKAITQELADGILKGEGMDDLAKRINDRIDAIGITRSRLLARTETMGAVNQAALSRYNKAGVSRVEWLSAADDGRTCDECIGLNGKIFPIDGVPDIPVHPNCRCTTAPLSED